MKSVNTTNEVEGYGVRPKARKLYLSTVEWISKIPNI